MKFYHFLLLFAFSLSACRDKGPEFDLGRTSKQQGPFGRDSVNVKLREVYSDSQVITRFEYTNGLFSGCRKFLKLYGYPAEFGVYTLFRENGLIVRYEKKTAEFIPEYLWVSDELETRAITTYEPATDSSWRVSDKYTINNQEIKRTITFARNGLIASEDLSIRYPELQEYTLKYQRDAAGNIVSVLNENKSRSNTQRIDYEYDNHPNPYFQLGVDLFGDESINVKSPNNITREVTFGANGQNRVVNYAYQYNAQGYPTQVTIRSKDPGSEEQVAVYDFKYDR